MQVTCCQRSLFRFKIHNNDAVQLKQQGPQETRKDQQHRMLNQEHQTRCRIAGQE